MIRAVWDPGVLIAAVINPEGAPGRGLRALVDQRWTLVLSPLLLDELHSVLRRPRFRRYLTETDAATFAGDVAGLGEVWDDPPDRLRLTRDPGDDYLVALALAAQADCIVSGDRDLHEAPHLGIEVLVPQAFLTRL